uniref:Uncharacterized protein n=1 Tax=viral metagenome TaxID=1070528 RepID=A0A6M3ID42_9ZZZZ
MWEIGTQTPGSLVYVADMDVVKNNASYQVVVIFNTPVPADLSQRIADAQILNLPVDGYTIKWVLLGGIDALEERVFGVEFATSNISPITIAELKTLYVNHPLFEGHPVDSVEVYEIVTYQPPPADNTIIILVGAATAVAVGYFLLKKKKKR